MVEDSPKGFSVSRLSFFSDLTTRLILTILLSIVILPFLIGIGLAFLGSYEADAIVIIGSLIIYIILVFFIFWLPFLKHAYRIIIVNGEIIFKTFLGKVRMELRDINALRTSSRNQFLKFVTVKKNILLLSTIKGWHELVRDLRRSGARIEIGMDVIESMPRIQAKGNIARISLGIAIIPSVIGYFIIPNKSAEPLLLILLLIVLYTFSFFLSYILIRIILKLRSSIK